MTKLLYSLSLREQVLCMIVLLGGIISSILDAISIGSVIPLISILLDPAQFNSILSDYFSENFIRTLDISHVVIIFCICVLSAAFFKAIIFWLNATVAQKIGKNLNASLIKRFYHCKPEVITKISFSEVSANFTTRSETITINVIQMFFSFIIGICNASLIMLFILYYDAYAFLITIIPVVIFYLVLQILVKDKLKKAGLIIFELQGKIMSQLDNLSRSMQEVFLYNQVSRAITPVIELDDLLKRTKANVQVLSNVPRYILEALALVSISASCIVLLDSGYSKVALLTTISVMTFSILRLVPAAHQIYASWSIFQSGYIALDKMYSFVEQLELLSLDLSQKNKSNKPDFASNDSKPLEDFRTLELQNISFRYPGTDKAVFDNLNFGINRGDVCLIKGPSGSGKTTLMNIIAGIYSGTSGTIKVNNTDVEVCDAYRNYFSIAPQDPYIMDGDIDDNIMFGSGEDIDQGTMKAIQDKLSISSLNINGANFVTMSKKLSGGQRQRVSLARCIAKKRPIALIDEGFSALDKDSKTLMFDYLMEMQETIIFISHSSDDEAFATKVIDLGKMK